jgi:hypothetical protein
MKTPLSLGNCSKTKWAAAFAACLLVFNAGQARASIAYGTINNFDTVNDTGLACHGFEIELDDVHSSSITYTYDYNHYGIPKITEDNSNPAHPIVYVRYQAVYASGTWSAFTAIPSAPIAPTMGHQFTNPSVNFGGEHFGVGYTGSPTTVKYNWLIDNGSGVLIHGGAVNVSTPVFTYVPPVAAAPGVPAVPAVVQAVIPVPVVPPPPAKEFGQATWLKEIRTTTHNNNPVKIEDLVSKDPDYPNAKNWTNNEPDEVEVEWQVLQYDSGAGVANGGANAQLAGAGEPLQNGDEVVTRRYEYYQYTGPLDSETGEAMAQIVTKGTVYGSGTATDPITNQVYNLSTMVVVGKFLGAQMSGFDAAAKLGLIDHLQDGEAGVPYVNRTVIVPGSVAFTGTATGNVPPGMSLDPVSGVFSGTPTTSGLYTFTVSATDLNNVQVTKDFTMAVAAAGGVLPAQSTITATASPDTQGSTAGSGTYFNGTNATVTATAAIGYGFLNWTEGGVVVSSSSSYTFPAGGNRTLVANFGATYSVTTSVSPLNSGTTTGDGSYAPGVPVNVTATPYTGYVFSNWSENGVNLSASSSYVFTSDTSHVLVANFVPASPTLAAVAAGTISSSGAVLGDTVNPNGVTTSAYYQFGLTGTYGSATASQVIGSGTSAIVVGGTLGGLLANTTYHFQLVTTGSAGTNYGGDQTFATLASPILTGTAASVLSASVASLGDLVNPNGVATSAYYQYGLTTGYGSTTVTQSLGSGTGAVVVGGTLSGLQSNTTYHYQLVTTGSAGTFYGADQTFVTPAGSYSLVLDTLRGDDAVGIPGALYSSLGNPAVNTSEHIAFQALISGTSPKVGIKAGNNSGIWADDNTGTRQLVVRTGTAVAAPGTAGAVFSALGDPVYNNNDRVAFFGTLKKGVGDATSTSNNTGIWSNDGGVLHVVARMAAPAPGCPAGAKFATLVGFAIADQGGVANDGGVVMLANLTLNAGGVTASNSQGVWAVDTSGSLQLIARQGDLVAAKTIAKIGFLPAVAAEGGQTRSFDQNTGDLLLSLTFTDGSQGIFNVVFSPAPVLSAVASANDSVAGIASALFAAFGSPAMNQSDYTAFKAIITGSAAGIGVSNNSGIWADDNTGTRQLVVQTGTASLAPGTAGAVFSALGDPVYNNNEVVAFMGTLKPGVGDAVKTPLNKTTGLWSNEGGVLHLVARTGVQAPDCPAGATFASVSQFALPDQGGASNQGGVVLLANLKPGAGGVNTNNNQGIWAVDTAGNLRLILRKGDSKNVDAGTKTITGITFLNAPAYAGGQTRSFNQSTGDLLVKLAFKDGSSGVFEVVFP